MVRTQIQLHEEQAEALKQMAAERDLSMAELIRQAIDRLIEAEGAVTWQNRQQRALAAAGRFRSGHDDLSSEHDRHLAEAYQA